MKVTYAMEQTSLCGGHKDIFEQANRLAARGHDVEIASIHQDATSWFPLRVPNRVYGNYPNLISYLSNIEAVKVATWWKTARPVAAAGGGAYFVQDVETSYAASAQEASRISDTYKVGLQMFTESRWIPEEMQRLGLPIPTYVGIGVDTEVFRPADIREPARDWVLFHERGHPLKGPETRLAVLRELRDRVTTVGYSPWQPNPYAAGHLASPSDEQLAEAMSQSLCLLVTSVHEGFCMPAMEAMACGLPVVTTNAHGNWFCQHGYNCLIGDSATELTEHILRLQKDHHLWRELRHGALATVEEHFHWDPVIDRLEEFLRSL